MQQNKQLGDEAHLHELGIIGGVAVLFEQAVKQHGETLHERRDVKPVRKIRAPVAERREQTALGDELFDAGGVNNRIPAFIFCRTGLELVFLETADDKNRAGRAIVYLPVDIDADSSFFDK